MPYETVLVERREAIGIVSLNRPAVLNALNRQMIRETRAALEDLEADSDVRVVILRGEGRAFCAGDDLAEDFSDIRTTADLLGIFERLQNVTRVLMRMPKPVIASMQGHAVGAGCEWSMNCDLRVAAAGTKFTFPEARWGYTVSNVGTKLLPLMIGLGRAKELVFTTDGIDAETAERWGLVNHVVPPGELDAYSMKLAARIASNSALSLALAKNLLNAATQMSYEDVLQQEIRDCAIVARSPETALLVAGARKRFRKQQA